MLKPDEIKRFMEDDSSSHRKRMARQGLKYYEGEHKIMGARILYMDADGNVKEDLARSNVRISHPFFTELADQEVQYMLSGDGNFIRSDDPGLQALLDEYFDDNFWAEVYEALTGCVVKGFDYLYAYYTRKNRIGFQHADSIGVIEVEAKDAIDGEDHVIYWYLDRMGHGEKEVRRIQVWDERETHYYVQEGGGEIIADDREPLNPRPHIITKNERGERFGSSFHFIPFFRIDNGSKRFSGLKPIKDLIDDYDLMACSLSNNLQDFTDAIYVVSGFQGADLNELITNIKAKKYIGTAPDGKLDIKTVDIPYEARKTKLELDEKNIYRFGMGFNSAQIGDGNITNIVIKSRYALLDLKCNKLEIRLKEFLKKIIKVVLDEINAGNGTDYQLKNVHIRFQREVITNAQDNAQIELTDAQRQGQQINNILAAANLLDDETVIRALCSILDIDYEEIKDRLPKGENGARDARKLLEDAAPDDEDGAVI